MKSLASNTPMQLALCYVGVVGSLLVYGVLQVKYISLSWRMFFNVCCKSTVRVCFMPTEQAALVNCRRGS